MEQHKEEDKIAKQRASRQGEITIRIDQIQHAMKEYVGDDKNMLLEKCKAVEQWLNLNPNAKIADYRNKKRVLDQAFDYIVEFGTLAQGNHADQDENADDDRVQTRRSVVRPSQSVQPQPRALIATQESQRNRSPQASTSTKRPSVTPCKAQKIKRQRTEENLRKQMAKPGQAFLDKNGIGAESPSASSTSSTTNANIKITSTPASIRDLTNNFQVKMEVDD